MKKYLFVMMIIFSGITQANPRSVNIEGNYHCEGYDPYDASHYKGYASIKKLGDTYSFKWDFGKDMIYFGTGIFGSDKRNIAVVFVNPTKSNDTGILIYQIQNNGILKDNWTFFGKTKIGHGVCKKYSV